MASSIQEEVDISKVEDGYRFNSQSPPGQSDAFAVSNRYCDDIGARRKPPKDSTNYKTDYSKRNTEDFDEGYGTHQPKRRGYWGIISRRRNLSSDRDTFQPPETIDISPEKKDEEIPRSTEKPPRGVAKVILGGLIQDVPLGFLPSAPFFRRPQPPAAPVPPLPPVRHSDTPPLEFPDEPEPSKTTSKWKNMARIALGAAPNPFAGISERFSRSVVGIVPRTASEILLSDCPADSNAIKVGDINKGDGNKRDDATSGVNKYPPRTTSTGALRPSLLPWTETFSRAISDFDVPNILRIVAATPRAAAAAAAAIKETLSPPEMKDTPRPAPVHPVVSVAPQHIRSRRADSTTSLPRHKTPILLAAAQNALPGLVQYNTPTTRNVGASTTSEDHETQRVGRLSMLPDFVRGIGQGLTVDNLLPPALSSRLINLTTQSFDPRDRRVANILLGRESRSFGSVSHLQSESNHGLDNAAAAAAAAGVGVGEPPSALSPPPPVGLFPLGPRPNRPISGRPSRQRACSVPRQNSVFAELDPHLDMDPRLQFDFDPQDF